MPCAASSRVFHDNDWYPQTTVGFFFLARTTSWMVLLVGRAEVLIHRVKYGLGVKY